MSSSTEISKLSKQKTTSQFKDEQILRGIQRIAELSRTKFNLPFKTQSQNAVAKLAAASEEKKRTVQNQIAVLERIISLGEIKEEKSERYEEWPLIQKALGLYNLRLKDDFEGILQKGDVVEVYNSDHIQIFRTFNFYEYSAYTCLDLLMNEWYHLWERPSYLLQTLMGYWEKLASGEKEGIVSMDEVPQHVYREVYNAGDTENFEARSVLCKFGYIAPLYKPNGEIGGFIINCRVKVLAYGEETKGLSFI